VGRGVLDPGSVDSLILSAPDVDRAGHSAWLEACRFARQVFVLSNANDSSLCILEAEIGRRRLGQEHPAFAGQPGESANRAANPLYVRLDDLGGGHNDYLIGQERVLQFLGGIVLRGVPDLAMVEEVEPGVLRLRRLGQEIP
jgi:hypothetical protein